MQEPFWNRWHTYPKDNKQNVERVERRFSQVQN